MQMKASVREFRKLLEPLGIKVIDVGISGGNHIRVTVTTNRLWAKGEKTFKLFTASTPSDSRHGLRNFLQDVRRVMREHEDRECNSQQAVVPPRGSTIGSGLTK